MGMPYSKLPSMQIFKLSMINKKLSEYDQEIPQLHTADQPKVCIFRLKGTATLNANAS